jgi:MoaA/NifB/PqqE/SkfB family radical SAM enzyme
VVGVDELDAIAARVRAREHAARVGGDAPGPWTLEVYPTLRCNLDCVFCDTTERHRPAVDELSPARWEALVDEAAALGARRILVLGGGEPLLALATPGILRRARAHDMHGTLTTNGSRLDAHAALLVELGWDEVHVSVDGATPETHDRLRGRAGAFRRTVSGLCRLRALRDSRGATAPRLALHTVITRANVHELADIVRLAHALGCGRVEFDALVAYRPEQEAWRLDAAGEALLAQVGAEATEVAERLGVTTTLGRFLAPGGVRRGEVAPPPGSGTGLAAAPCLKPWHHLVVGPSGRIAPCCVRADEGPSVRGTSLATVWGDGPAGSPELAALRASLRAGVAPGRCAECSPNLLAHEVAVRARL